MPLHTSPMLAMLLAGNLGQCWPAFLEIAPFEKAERARRRGLEKHSSPCKRTPMSRRQSFLDPSFMWYCD